MVQKYSHQLVSGVSFGLTSGVITALGMIVGLHSATCSKVAVVAGIVVMAVADGLADAMGFHVIEESEMDGGKVKHTAKEVWLSTLFTFLGVGGVILTFAIPFLFLALKNAIFVAIAWGFLLLSILNFNIARAKGENAMKIVAEHIVLAIFVVVISHYIGDFIGMRLK